MLNPFVTVAFLVFLCSVHYILSNPIAADAHCLATVDQPPAPHPTLATSRDHTCILQGSVTSAIPVARYSNPRGRHSSLGIQIRPSRSRMERVAKSSAPTQRTRNWLSEMVGYSRASSERLTGIHGTLDERSAHLRGRSTGAADSGQHLPWNRATGQMEREYSIGSGQVLGQFTRRRRGKVVPTAQGRPDPRARIEPAGTDSELSQRMRVCAISEPVLVDRATLPPLKLTCLNPLD